MLSNSYYRNVFDRPPVTYCKLHALEQFDYPEQARLGESPDECAMCGRPSLPVTEPEQQHTSDPNEWPMPTFEQIVDYVNQFMSLPNPGESECREVDVALQAGLTLAAPELANYGMLPINAPIPITYMQLHQMAHVIWRVARAGGIK